jgi:polyferredoxin
MDGGYNITTHRENSGGAIYRSYKDTGIPWWRNRRAVNAMKITSSFKRTVAAALLTAGLAYPACAAVCPKGIGGCPTPGRCFLFTDADANSFCDYTSRTVSQTTSGASPSSPGAPAPAQTSVQITAPATQAPDLTTVQSTATPTPADPVVLVSPGSSQVTQIPHAAGGANATTPVLQNASSGGFLDSIHLSAPLAAVFLFFFLTGIFFVLIRTGVFGTGIQKTRPALALSTLFGLGASLIITYILAGGTIAGTTFALVYMGAGTLIAAYLWYSGVVTRKIAFGAAVFGALAGFVFLAPIMPLELGGIVNVISGASILTPGIIVIGAVILVTLLVGRTFCGQICPVGSLQELAYEVPVKKFVIRHTEILELVRLAVFLATVIAAIYLIDLMAITGLYDLFSLTISAGLVIAAGIILLAAFLYRPVCRIICPFGVLFSLFAEFSLFRLKRTETCIHCKKCEKACPARTAGEETSKRECYLCSRCKDACPVSTALVYRR